MEPSPKQIKEDVPELRSVMMARPMVAPPMSFSSMGPPSLKTRQSIPNKASSAPALAWNASDLPSLPQDYPLGRTNVYVQSSGQEVADRICNFLKNESIKASISDVEKSQLNAETSKDIRFTVSLFEDQGMTVVEVQRMAGCGFEFSQVAKGVCRTARGMSSAPKRKLPMPSCIPRQNPDDKLRRLEGGLKVALDMVCSSRQDLRILGLKSLEQISASLDMTEHMANMILSGECPNKLYSLIVMSGTSSLSESEERDMETERRASLTVMANSLKVSPNAPGLSVAIGGNVMKEFVSALVGFLDNSTSSPLESVQAVRCLQSIHNHPEAVKALRDLDINNAVGKACSAGAASCLQLNIESEKLKNLLLYGK